MTRPVIAWVGADGALGKALAPALGARGVALRCPDATDLSPVAELAGVDVVVNAAGPRVHPGLDWADYMREHVGTATRVARSMRQGSHLLLVSSAAVYGAGRAGVSASSTPPDPASFPVPAYAWAKLAAEHASLSICERRGIGLTILRPSIIYGEGAGGVLIRLRDMARRGARAVLRPVTSRQHWLHLSLLHRVLEGLVAAGAPREPATHVVADPFVLTSEDLNASLRELAPRSLPIPVPLSSAAGAVRGWARVSRRPLPVQAAAVAMLDLDNAYDWRSCLSTLAIDPGPYGRGSFDSFIRA